MPKSELNLLVAPLKWACEASKGTMNSLAWVDSTLYEQQTSFRFQRVKGKIEYRHRPYGSYLPRIMNNSAISAQRNGEPTVLEGVLLLFARMEWLTSARRYIWSPMSPVPELLAILVESMGIGNEIHRNDREILSRLASRLPTWMPMRGSAKSARSLLTETVGEQLNIKTVQAEKDSKIDEQSLIVGEALSCQSTDWWRRRLPEGDNPSLKMDLRLSGGFLSFQSLEQPMPLHREDVLVGWKVSESFPTNLLRLLPAWSSLRVVILKEDSQ